MKKIAVASDHAGFLLKKDIKVFLGQEEYSVIDLGPDSEESVDYPEFAHKLANFIREEKIPGIAICGTGIGITMAAGKLAGVRAANCTNCTMARLAREHNDANVLGLGSRLIGIELAKDIVKIFLNTKFAGGRHQNRVNQIELT